MIWRRQGRLCRAQLQSMSATIDTQRCEHKQSLAQIKEKLTDGSGDVGRRILTEEKLAQLWKAQGWTQKEPHGTDFLE